MDLSGLAGQAKGSSRGGVIATLGFRCSEPPTRMARADLGTAKKVPTFLGGLGAIGLADSPVALVSFSGSSFCAKTRLGDLSRRFYVMGNLEQHRCRWRARDAGSIFCISFGSVFFGEPLFGWILQGTKRKTAQKHDPFGRIFTKTFRRHCIFLLPNKLNVLQRYVGAAYSVFGISHDRSI